MRYTKLTKRINMIATLFEKVLKESRVVKKTYQKEGEGSKKLFIHFLDKRKDFMKSTGTQD